jgi:hypothetical protein
MSAPTDGTAQAAQYEVGVITHIDREGFVTAYQTSHGFTRPVAFLPRPPHGRRLLVPQEEIDVGGALLAARRHSPFGSLDEIRETLEPLRHSCPVVRLPVAELEAGA